MEQKAKLEQIETDAEWDMIEEVFHTFMAERRIEQKESIRCKKSWTL